MHRLYHNKGLADVISVGRQRCEELYNLRNRAKNKRSDVDRRDQLNKLVNYIGWQAEVDAVGNFTLVKR